MRRRSQFAFSALAVPALASMLVACGADLGQARLCERALLRLVDDPKSIEIITREEVPGEAASVRLVYKTTGSRHAGATKDWIVCRFDSGRTAGGRLELVGVRTSSLGKLRIVALVHLRRQMGYRRPPPERANR